jgi:hypothetical protein
MLRRGLTRALAVVLVVTAILKVLGALGVTFGVPPVPAGDRTVLPDGVVLVIAGFEFALGVGLFRRADSASLRVLTALFLTAATCFAFFLRLNGIPLGRCGCFGPVSDPMSSVHLALNGVLLLAAGYVVLGEREPEAAEPAHG